MGITGLRGCEGSRVGAGLRGGRGDSIPQAVDILPCVRTAANIAQYESDLPTLRASTRTAPRISRCTATSAMTRGTVT